jgi:hypothetical protein
VSYSELGTIDKIQYSNSDEHLIARINESKAVLGIVRFEGEVRVGCPTGSSRA